MSASRHRASCLLAPALLAGLLTLGLFLPAPAPAQSEPEQGPENEFAITTETGHILFVLQEQWEQWQGAFRLGDREGGDEALTFLLEALHALGMETIPEYAPAAAVLALKASLEGRFEQARWALKAAERLDPSVSEAAFARSALQRAEGERMPAMASRVEGYLRIWETPLRRILLVNDLLIWALAVVFLTCALFVVVQAAAKGGGIYSGLVRMLERWLPAYGAHAVVVVAILWPLILPSGVVCLLIYWSVMLWGFSTRSEKLVLLLAWIMLGVSPMLLETQRQRLSLAGSAASRALEGLDRHRLGGSLLSDLGVLASALPEDPAVDQLLGDVHRRFGQWEDARDRYLRVIDKEPKNVGALINVGVYYFLSGDLESAAEVFQRAAKLSPGSAVPYYNLSETYSASYAFERAEQSLVRARQVDARAVDRWIRREEGSRPVAVNGGLERSGEIRSRLHKLWKRTGLLLTWDEMLTRNRSLPVALALLGSAMALGWLRRRVPRLLVVRPAVEVGSSLDRWRRIFLPGIGSAESGHGLAAFAALLLPVFLICLPVTRQLGYPIPWALDPGTRPLGVAATVAFALWLAWHLWRQLRTWRQA